MLRTLDISRSALVATREQMNVIAGNLANAQATRDEAGNVAPFQRRYVEFIAQESEPGGAPEIAFEVHKDKTGQPRLVYEPGHPDADENGFVRYPDINPIHEMTDMLVASRAHEANVAAVQATQQMVEQTLRLLQ